jgi:hypothetical protein
MADEFAKLDTRSEMLRIIRNITRKDRRSRLRKAAAA